MNQSINDFDDPPVQRLFATRAQILVISAAMLALFLGALDALIVGAAMPTIVADLGGLHLYSWVFSAYLLTRAVSLPIFGKLCDLFSSKTLYMVAIVIFLASSMLAGTSQSMTQLIIFRAFQGIGAGGNFALAYIVAADLSSPQQRGKMMGVISFVWGVASVLGPALGGFIVTYSTWRWIFYINIPLGGLAFLGIALYLSDVREKKKDISIDYLGAAALSVSVLSLLAMFLVAGRIYSWLSVEVAGLLLLVLGASTAFYFAEKRAQEPVLALDFFRVRGFSIGNGAAFFSSFAIFSLAAYFPLFIQGALGRTPAELGVAMIPLSFGWSGGALLCGQLINRKREKPFAVFGSLLLIGGSAWMLTFSTETSLLLCSTALVVTGLGMGFVSIGTLLIVQNSLQESDLGVATSSHQFSRTLGGTIGIGASGSLATAVIVQSLVELVGPEALSAISLSSSTDVAHNIRRLFQPEVQVLLSDHVRSALQQAVAKGLGTVFWFALLASIVCLVFAFLLPRSSERSG